MMVHIRQVLSPDQVAELLRLLNAADWIDGRETTGYLGARVKNNVQLAENSPLARQLGEVVLDALDKNPQFRSAALPLTSPSWQTTFRSRSTKTVVEPGASSSAYCSMTMMADC